MLDICTALERDGAEVPLDDAARAELDAVFKAKGEQGFRVLALATRRVAAQPDYDREDERDMVFRGFLVFLDPPKPEAQQTIGNLARLGIAIKVISGDNRHVTAHMAEAVGLDATSMLTGEELAGMKDEALWHLAPRTDLFVEIDPQQKERIVRALQRTGNSVGYLGDGINDAPALHAADVGISVAEAVDVARESADIILLSRDLDVLRQGVEDGRRTFANTLKYISITTSANFGNMISMALATPLLPFLPLAAKQILLNNFLSDLPSHGDLQRQCGSRARVQPAALERQGHPALHDRLRPDQLGLRPADLRRPALRLPRGRGDVPDLVVHDLAPDRTGGRARPAHPQARLPQPAQPIAPVVDPRRRDRHLAIPFLGGASAALRLRAAVGLGIDRRGGDPRRIHRGHGDREGVVLPG